MKSVAVRLANNTATIKMPAAIISAGSRILGQLSSQFSFPHPSRDTHFPRPAGRLPAPKGAPASTINYLVENKLFDRNKQLPFPDVIQQIALISNESAAGYIDFIDQLENNTHGFQFNVTLFRSALQGQAVANEFPEAVERINKSNNFDVIVIIRGGGSKMDLSAFDSLEAAKAVANSKYPVITGIGHEIDETVCDLIASVRMKTPTAVASYIIEHNARYEKRLSELCEQVNQIIK